MPSDKTLAVVRGILAKSMLYNPHTGDASQLAFLYDLATKAPDGPAVEVGVRGGGSFLCWSMARKGRGRIIAADDWSSLTEATFRGNAKDCTDIEILTASSWLTPERIGEPVAFAFLDCDHGENGIPKDILVWPEAIMPGGIIAFHDYGVWKPTVVVKREVDAWQELAQWEPLGLVSSIIAFRRPIV